MLFYISFLAEFIFAVVRRGAATNTRASPDVAVRKKRVRKEVSRETKRFKIVTTVPPRSIPIGIDPHAKKR